MSHDFTEQSSNDSLTPQNDHGMQRDLDCIGHASISSDETKGKAGAGRDGVKTDDDK